MSESVRYVLYSQLALVVAIMLCTFIAPGFLFSTNEGGISNYAIHANTVVPFSLGFVGCAGLLLAAAGKMARVKRLTILAPWLRVTAIGYLIVLASTYPYKYQPVFQQIHQYVSLAFSVLMLVVLLHFSRLLKKTDAASIAYLCVMGAGFLVGITTLTGAIHLLFASQLLVGAGFGLGLVHNLQRFGAAQ